MSLTINTNLSSLIVQSSLTQSTNGLNQAIERMTTGFKINGAKDNAAGYSIANNMGVKLSSYDVAMDNVMLGTTLIDTASSNLSLITEHLQRMRDLAEQAANGTYGDDSLNAIQSEIDARTEEINRVMSNTEYNGIKLFEGEETAGTGGATANVDESKRVVNQTTFQSGETYYITTSDDLVKLQDLVNSGVDTTNVTFELMNDIDMKGVSFRGIGTGGADGNDDTKFFKGNFNGNEHVISNLTINTSEDMVGLFGATMGNIDSLGLENCDITGGTVGGLVAMNTGNITNSYVTGKITSVGDEKSAGGFVSGNMGNINNCYSECEVITTGKAFYVGGFVGGAIGGMIENSYSVAEVSASSSSFYVGGFSGFTEELASSVSFSNCYAGGSLSGGGYDGGFIGVSNSSINISDCYTDTSVQGGGYYKGAFIGYDAGTGTPTITNSYYDSTKNGAMADVGSGTYSGTLSGVSATEFSNLLKAVDLPDFSYGGGGSGTVNNSGREFILQVGIDSSDNSKLSFDTALCFQLNIDVTSHAGALDALTVIDNILETVNKKQTEFGAVQNRLESVTEALSINIENLTSSMSTIKDADIAEESSNYIKYQILQQASATLLATANQTPSIALQLL
ncbi:MAG: hypothetical protein BHW62_04430 [Acinetobacter sp. CAG:196_36_41]|nr:MAG: hypothetical protein BHW62_04430 [Acinetobacter sp. CAG:196_36_41]